MKVYGNLMNRLDENKQFVEEIKVGTGVTEYSWSDRHAYEVVDVTDQKHITIREYDAKHIGGEFENKWELVSNPKNTEIELVKRGGYWYIQHTCTKEMLSEAESKRNSGDYWQMLYICNHGFDLDVIRKKGKQTKYTRMNISIGKADYYYDYSF